MNDEAIKLVNSQAGPRAADLFKNLLDQKPESAEAIVFLQGDQLDRAELVLKLYQQKWAPRVILTGNNKMMERRQRNDENDLYLADIEIYLKKNGLPEKSLIIDDQAMNTKDQAVNVIRLAKNQGWKKLLVVTSAYHLLRSFLTLAKQALDQEWPGEIKMQAPGDAWSKIPTGRKKTALAMLAEEIDKLKRYRTDLAFDKIS